MQLSNYEWWLIATIPALWRLRQEDCHKFKATLGYKRPWLNKIKRQFSMDLL